MNKIFIDISGPIASGKSTIAKMVQEKLPKTVVISNDRIKHFFSDYKSETDRGTLSLIVFDFTKRALEGGFNVIKESHFYKEQSAEHELYKLLFSDLRITPFQFVLEAKLETLISRNIKRSNKNTHISKQMFTEHYKSHQHSIPLGTTFNTEELTSEAIVDKILQEIYA